MNEFHWSACLSGTLSTRFSPRSTQHTSKHKQQRLINLPKVAAVNFLQAFDFFFQELQCEITKRLGIKITDLHNSSKRGVLLTKNWCYKMHRPWDRKKKNKRRWQGNDCFYNRSFPAVRPQQKLVITPETPFGVPIPRVFACFHKSCVQLSWSQ